MLSAEWRVRSSEWNCCKNSGSAVIPHSACPRTGAFRTPHSKGFTLLEVMVAVAILAIVLVSLMGLQNRSMQDVALAERITVATLLAKRVMTDTLLAKPLVPQEKDGERLEQVELVSYE